MAQNTSRSSSKVALITGGASGMGLATAKSLASQGWKLVIADINRKQGAEAALELDGLFAECDVTKYESISNAFAQTWNKYGRLDFVFANAGIIGRSDFYAKQMEDSNGVPPAPDMLSSRVMYDGVIMTVYLAQHFLRKNKTPGGSIIVLASSGGIYASPRNPLYSSSKAGVIGLTRSISQVLKADNIHVSCVCPGSVATGLMTEEQFSKLDQDTFTPLSKIVGVINMLLRQEDSTRGAAVEVIKDRHYLRWRPDFCDKYMEKCWHSMGGSSEYRDDGLTVPSEAGP